MSRTRLSAHTAPPAEVARALSALRAEHGILASFPPQALAEAEQAAARWADGGAQRLLDDGARDARDLPLVTIDPAGSMDLDQALALESLGPPEQPAATGTGQAPAYRVHYAIASLATFVRPGGALDAELRRRGETVYAPDHATPLHPEILSHGAASLLEEQDRPACLWTIDLDARGEILHAHVERALVRSRARLSYAQVQAALDGRAGLDPRAPGDLPRLLERIGRLRQEREAARGGVSLATPEQTIEAVDGAPGAPSAPGAAPQPAAVPAQEPAHAPEAPDGAGEQSAGAAPGGYRLVFRAALPVEGYNAQISLLTGICAARIMMGAGIGILRTMPPAAPEDHRRLRRVARALRIDWPQDLPYPELVRSLDHTVPAHAAFLDQALSLFRGAGYLALPEAEDGAGPEGAERTAHAAIASPYAHVTAPLRRLVDRYGEEVCIAVCAGRPVPDWAASALPELPEAMARTGRRARAVGRGAISALEAMVMSGHEGEVFEGVILSVRQGRGELMVSEPAVIAELRGEEGRGDHDPAGQDRGGEEQGGARLPLGEMVRARLIRADPAAGRTEFLLV
ncbi:RNB domain-containing ribonuclease [Actinomyces bowdenii]|uniref:RNB domain-containing ribonuclease n=1 Tax=Actinomyces bowdenii TaxID=131109 RepID=A0A3P1VB62_9ACTO|nr:RNB domain-containing ribonuclease [Actinomyces bowdenii]RRD30897.1 RNB domain-containing ribonuclease [Actinomyces bowdenii]